MNNLIYVADNDLANSRQVQDFLEAQSFDVECFKTGEQLYNAYQYKKCALAILSSAMPGSDGFEVGVKMKRHPNTSVIMLTPEDANEDRAFAMSLGLDAYLIKPLCLSKLTSYVKALMIKAEQHAQSDQSHYSSTKKGAAAREPEVKNQFTFGDVNVCTLKRMANCSGEDIPLTNTEFQILTLMVSEQHRAIHRTELLTKIWGEDATVGPRATDDIVKRLRRKLKEVGSQVTIDTVWGYGFRLGAPA